ncbi:MAG: hypothetical protein CO035_07885, partial [Candidatus Omnitrophica bacterium CG_4_9_14_0_2_um_filter_42_8]
YKIEGKILWLLSESIAETRTEGMDIFGGTYITASKIKNIYGVINKELDNQGLFDRKGKTIWGLKRVRAMEVSVTDKSGNTVTYTGTVTIGSDIFGAHYVTTVKSRYEIVANRAIAIQTESTTTGEDSFGGKYTTVTTTKYEYNFVTIRNKRHYLMTRSESYSVTNGEDFFGAKYITASNIEYIYGLINDRLSSGQEEGVKYQGRRPVWSLKEVKNKAVTITNPWTGETLTFTGSITIGKDMFGSLYTTTSVSTWRVWGNRAFTESTIAVTTGSDKSGLGSTYTTTTTTTYEYGIETINGRKAYVMKAYINESITTGTDTFDNDYVSASKTRYVFGTSTDNMTKDEIGKANGRQVWHMISVEEMEVSVTMDLDGNPATT